jgi:hypothetical protein
MTDKLDLQELERKAFRSTYQDGLWDLYFGLIVICMALFIYRPAAGYSPMNIVLALSSMGAAYALFWAAKKFITLPRMGQVRFGAQREKRKRTLVLVMSAVVLIQVSLISLQLWAWAHPEVGARLNGFLADRDLMDLAVASVAALMVGPSMILVAYFIDFPRGYFIASLIALAVFLMIYLNQPVYPIVIGMLIAVPGLVLFVRFLQKYPLRREDASRE